MTDPAIQRLILALEANTAAHQDLLQAIQDLPATKEDPPKMYSIPRLAQALGMSKTFVYKKVMSGEWPSEGEGRNRRVNVDLIQKIRKQEARVFQGGMLS